MLLWENMGVSHLTFLDDCRLYTTTVQWNQRIWTSCGYWLVHLFVSSFFSSVYVLESYIALNFRFLIYKQVSTKILLQFYELPEESVKQSSKGLPSLVLLSVDKFAVEICSGKMEEFLAFCNCWKDIALSNCIDFSSWLLFSKSNSVKMNFVVPAMN